MATTARNKHRQMLKEAEAAAEAENIYKKQQMKVKMILIMNIIKRVNYFILLNYKKKLLLGRARKNFRFS